MFVKISLMLFGELITGYSKNRAIVEVRYVDRMWGLFSRESGGYLTAAALGYLSLTCHRRVNNVAMSHCAWLLLVMP